MSQKTFRQQFEEEKGYPSLVEFLQSMIKKDRINVIGVCSFWNTTEVAIGPGGHQLIEDVKNKFYNQRFEIDWLEKSKEYTRDIDDLPEDVKKKIPEELLENLKESYLYTIFKIAKNVVKLKLEVKFKKLGEELQEAVKESNKDTAEPVNVKKKRKLKLPKLKSPRKKAAVVVTKVKSTSKKVQHLRATIAAVNARIDEFEARMDQIQKQLMPLTEQKTDGGHVVFKKMKTVHPGLRQPGIKYFDYEPDKVEKAPIPLLSDSTDSSSEAPLPPPPRELPTDKISMILRALTSGGDIDNMQGQYYGTFAEDKPEVNDVFGTFKKLEAINVQPFYLFDEDCADLREAIVQLLDYAIVLRKEEIDGKAFRKSAKDKNEALVGQLHEFLNPETSLEQVKHKLEEHLGTKDGTGLLQNRGPFHAYWVGSFFKKQKNPVNDKYINSTVESKLVDLYKQVLEVESNRPAEGLEVVKG